MVNSKQKECSELQQRLLLLSSLFEALNTQQTLLPKLRALNCGAAVWTRGLQRLAQQLEFHLHQISLSPATLPQSSGIEAHIAISRE